MQARLQHYARRLTSMHHCYCTKPDRPKLSLNSQKGVMQFIDSTGGAGASRNGRSWRTSELRLKSYDDLHRLWFILLKERNILLTERDWCRSNGRHWVNGQSNLYKVKRSMARIKGVVGERIRALKAKRELEAKRAEGHSDTDPSSPGLQDALKNANASKTSGVVTRV